jgi:hypothetical protein
MTDEHGRLDPGYEHEHGPEWWAMDREACSCGHHFTEHRLVPKQHRRPDSTPCDECNCLDFTPSTAGVESARAAQR